VATRTTTTSETRKLTRDDVSPEPLEPPFVAEKSA
jgi:hypothetical protein